VETPVLDSQRLEAACMGQAQLRAMLVEAFVNQTPARLDKLRLAVVAGNAADVEFEAHGMKGMCATIGAMRCAEVFEHMERLAAQKRLEPLAYKLQRAETELTRVDEWLKEPPAQAA
jgi:HPt (histidine-containing phosphotransfer) domain-containing protein